MGYTDVLRIVGLAVLWGLAIIAGVIVFLTGAELLVAIGSTGFGAIILALLLYKAYRIYQDR